MADPFTPITTSQRLELPKGHRMYTTTRQCAMEMPLPNIGDTMATFLPGALAANIIVDVWETPTSDGQKKITVQHLALPAGSTASYETVAYIFPPIYPNATVFFPGGSNRRARNVLGRLTYEFSRTPAATWGGDPAIWDFATLSSGPFEVESYLAKAAAEQFEGDDGSTGTVGEFMNQNFVAYDTVNNEFTIYAPGDLFYVVPASRPSATQYAAWVAAQSELIVSRTVDDWYGDISMRRTVYVRAQ